MLHRRSLWIWLALYLLTMGAIVWGLREARARVLAEMSDPATRAAWRAWADETRRPTTNGQPVARRPVKSDDPPSLILMRDHFGSILSTCLVIGTFVFAFLGFLARGIWQQSRAAANAPPS